MQKPCVFEFFPPKTISGLRFKKIKRNPKIVLGDSEIVWNCFGDPEIVLKLFWDRWPKQFQVCAYFGDNPAAATTAATTRNKRNPAAAPAAATDKPGLGTGGLGTQDWGGLGTRDWGDSRLGDSGLGDSVSGTRDLWFLKRLCKSSCRDVKRVSTGCETVVKEVVRSAK